jgi:fermentation-respiration switch protein FrsA (DUF1100 family)
MGKLTRENLAVLSMASPACRGTMEADAVHHAGRDPEGARGVPVIRQALALRFLGADGAMRERAARLYVPRDAEVPMPVVLSIHYEMPEGDLALHDYLSRGWAVLTPVDIPIGDLTDIVGDDFRFSNALLSAARRLPLLDGQRIGMRGASAGGYHVLLLSALRAGVCCAYDMSGVCNLPYEFGRYIPAANEHNLRMAVTLSEGQRADFTNYLIPFVKTVADTFEPTRAALGAADPTARRWLMYSPVSHLGRISQPLLLSHSTADAIVPVYQVTEARAYGSPGCDMPGGFLMHLRDLMPRGVGDDPLDALVPPGELAVYTLSPPPEGGVNRLRFDPDRLFSLNLIDEGPIERACSHFKSLPSGAVSDLEFFSYRFKAGAAGTNRLTPAKLLTLAERYSGAVGFFEGEAAAKAGAPSDALGSLESDRLDVLLELLACVGLEPFRGDNAAPGPERLEALRSAYGRLDDGLRFLGPEAGDGRALLSRALVQAAAHASVCGEKALRSGLETLRQGTDR